jgi:type II secretory pathway component PulJ
MRLEARSCCARAGSAGGFTLAEVLAALMFMAIVIPVAVEGLRIANLSGQVGQRKVAAARIAERMLNELLVTGQYQNSAPHGTEHEGPYAFEWRMNLEPWTPNVMRLLSVQVDFQVQGKPYDVRLSTLVDTQ